MNSKEVLAQMLLEMTFCYQSQFRYQSDDKLIEMTRYWGAVVLCRVSAEDIDDFRKHDLGRGVFSSSSPGPYQFIEFVQMKKHPNFCLAMELDKFLAASYLSLYTRDIQARFDRIKEVCSLLDECEIGSAGVQRILQVLRAEGEWKTYPPTVADIQALVQRVKFGIGSLDEEFSNYLARRDTPGVRAVLDASGRDFMRSLPSDRVYACFRRGYYVVLTGSVTRLEAIGFVPRDGEGVRDLTDDNSEDRLETIKLSKGLQGG